MAKPAIFSKRPDPRFFNKKAIALLSFIFAALILGTFVRPVGAKSGFEQREGATNMASSGNTKPGNTSVASKP